MSQTYSNNHKRYQKKRKEENYEFLTSIFQKYFVNMNIRPSKVCSSNMYDIPYTFDVSIWSDVYLQISVYELWMILRLHLLLKLWNDRAWIENLLDSKILYFRIMSLAKKDELTRLWDMSVLGSPRGSPMSPGKIGLTPLST